MKAVLPLISALYCFHILYLTSYTYILAWINKLINTIARKTYTHIGPHVSAHKFESHSTTIQSPLGESRFYHVFYFIRKLLTFKLFQQLYSRFLYYIIHRYELNFFFQERKGFVSKVVGRKTRNERKFCS